MEAILVVKELVTKKAIGKINIPKRRGPKGYKTFLKVRLLLYEKLKGYFSTRKLRNHLQKRPNILMKLELKTLPSRKTIDRWKKQLGEILEQFIRLTGDNYIQTKLSEWTILDSTPMEDENDTEAKTGYTSKGKFRGFKLHMSCDEYEVPLRAIVTTGNVHDSQKGKHLLAPTPLTGGDAGYDDKEIKKAAKQLGSKPILVHNPRREGKEKKRKTPRILKAVRVCIEQCNGFIKNEVMERAWTKVRGLAAKTVFALTAVLAIQAVAIYSLKRYNYPSIRIQRYRI